MENFDVLGFKLVKTTKNKEAVIINGYMYYINKKNKKKTTYYKCRLDGCKSTVTISDDEPRQIVRLNLCHDHDGVTDIQMKINETLKIIKDRCENELSPIKKIYDDEVLKLDEIIALQFPEIDSIASTLYKHRLKNLPKLPKSTDDIILDGMYIKLINYLRELFELILIIF